VLVTRPRESAGGLAVLLEAAGFRVHAVPAITTESIGPDSELAAALAGPTAYDWIVVTSPTGARVVAGLMAGRTGSAGRRPRWAAVGPATARALEVAGFRVDAIPERPRGAAVADAIAAVEPVGGLLVLLARADAAATDLPEALRAAGAVVDDRVAYRTLEAPPASLEPLAVALADPDLGAIVVASGSAVRGLLGLAERIGREAVERVRRTPLVSIGPATSEAARAAGLDVAVESTGTSADAMASAVLGLFEPAIGAYR
jgi:uroporphyrinogen-III synthase